MPLRWSSCSDPYCSGVILQIGDRSKLAHSIALILAQQYSAARNVALGQVPNRQKLTINADAIIEERLGTKGKDGKESDQACIHRDGLLFQLIAWLGSHLDATPNDIIARPHLIKASKGIDNGIVHLGPNQDVAGVTICEDKATDNPRTLIHSDIWPEFAACEKGERDDELRTFVIDALVRRQIGEEMAEQTAGAILWHNCRRYRVRTTVGSTHSTPPTRGDLFKGFDVHVAGDSHRRRGETLFILELRNWMNSLAQEVADELRRME